MPLMPKLLSGVWSPSAPGMNRAAPPSRWLMRRVNGPTMPECSRALALRMVGCTAKLPKVAIVLPTPLPGTNARSQASS